MSEIKVAFSSEIEEFFELIDAWEIDEVKAYLKKGMPVNLYFNGTTPIIKAVEGGFKETIEFLIAEGADLEVKDKDGDTALHTAINWLKVEVVELLIKAGADPLAVNKHGWNLYMIAVWFNNEKLQELLKGHKADVVKDDKLDFFAAIADGNLSEVKKFIEQGIDINSKFINGESEVTIAAAFGQEETLKYFIEAGVDMNLCNDFGKDAFAYAQGKEGILKILNEYKEK